MKQKLVLVHVQKASTFCVWFKSTLTCAFICSKFVVDKMIWHLFGRKLLCVT